MTKILNENSKAIYVFIDSRDSTKFFLNSKDSSTVLSFVKSSNRFILKEFEKKGLENDLNVKPLGDGILFFHLFDESNDREILAAKILRIIEASEQCVLNYNEEMREYIEIDNLKTSDHKYELGVSISYGNNTTWEYTYNNITLTDIISSDLNYVFRLNKLAKPKGIVIDKRIFYNYIDRNKNIFKPIIPNYNEIEIHIDDVFKKQSIYISQEINIKLEESADRYKNYREIAQIAIEQCNSVIPIWKNIRKSFPFQSAPPLRILLFKCEKKQIREVYCYQDGKDVFSNQSTFDLEEKSITKDEKGRFKNLIYESYVKKEICSFAFECAYYNDKEKYLRETLEHFFITDSEVKNDEERYNFIKNFFETSFFEKTASSLVIPFTNEDEIDKGEINWLLAIDSTWPQLFLKKQIQFQTLGGAIFGSVRSLIKKIEILQ